MPMPSVTPNGYSVYECMSAMQKCVRRGLEADAMFWALELDAAGLYPHAANRLRVTSQEDIGLADPAAVLFANQALDLADKWRKAENGAWRIALGNAVRALARAPKSRQGDTFQAAAQHRLATGDRPPVPDFALDRHTQRGRKAGRGLDHWLAEGCVLSPPDPTPDPYLPGARAFWAAEVQRRSAPPPGQAELFHGTRQKSLNFSGEFS